MRRVGIVIVAMIAAAPPGVVADMDEKITDLAKQHIATLNTSALSRSLSPLLAKLGHPVEEHGEIITRVGWDIASCIVDGLEEDKSPISQAAILEMSDGADFVTGKTEFENLYTEEEIDEYRNAYIRLQAHCSTTAFEKNYLLVR